MLNIQIDSKYRITADERQFILQRQKVIGENGNTHKVKFENMGNVSWEDIAYCRTIQQAVTEYTRERVLKSDVTTFTELFALLNEIKNLIKSLPDIDNLLVAQ